MERIHEPHVAPALGGGDRIPVTGREARQVLENGLTGLQSTAAGQPVAASARVLATLPAGS